MNSSKKTLRELIRTIKIHTGHTQAQIADAAGYNRSYLSQAINSGQKGQIYDVISERYKSVLNGVQEVPQIIKPSTPKEKEQEDYMRKYIEILEVKAKEESAKLSQIQANLDAIQGIQQTLLENQQWLKAGLEKGLKMTIDRDAIFGLAGRLSNKLLVLEQKIDAWGSAAPTDKKSNKRS